MSGENNNNHNTLLPVPSSPDLMPAPFSPGPSHAPHSQEPLKKIMAVMRGRWVLATALALGLGLLGAFSGYMAGRHMLHYTSTGIIRVIAKPTQTLYRTQENEQISATSFVYVLNTQAQKIQQPRILRAASNHPDVRTMDYSGYADLVAFLKSGLEVRTGDKDELIWVDFTHKDPKVAHQAATAIVRAYMDLEGERSVKESNDRRSRLESSARAYEHRLNDLFQQKGRITTEFKTPDLKLLHEKRLEEAIELKKRLTTLRQQLALARVDVQALDRELEAQSQAPGSAEDSATSVAAAADEAPPEDPLTPEAVAEFDEPTRRLLGERNLIKDDLERMTSNLGPEHREVKEINRLLARKDRQIEERLAHVRAKGLEALPITPEGLQSAEQLKAQYSEVKSLYDLAAADVENLNDAITRVDRMTRDIEVTQKHLDEIEKALEEIRIEQGAIERIEVSNEPELPTEASWDKRKLFTAGGLMFGGGLGFGMVLLMGLMDRRIRSVEDAHETFAATPVLGILPTLPGGDLTDPEQAALASHCVHQVRTLLQIGPESQGRRVFTITSPSPQDGKTSMVLSLGLSFAASGAKTLLIDCDLGFGGLSHRLNAAIHRRIGQILLRDGLVTAQQVDQALHISRESNRRLGETLVDLGYLGTDELDQALESQERSPVGLLDAISGEPLDECVTQTGIKNLHILPIGIAGVEHVARLSPTAIRRLLEQARAQFDVVLVDTGSVLGSLEASHMAVESDGVVIVMSRGGQRELAEQAIEHLYTIGSRVAGIVFNRAAGRDVEIIAERSVSSMKPKPGPAAGENGHPKRREGSRMGPLAGAVVSSGRSGSAEWDI